MSKIYQIILSFKTMWKEPARRRNPHHRPGQSLVEIAISFPLIIMLLSGVVEFGFIINYYLSLLDATREAARYYSNGNPFNDDGSDNITFYSNVAALVLSRLQGVDPSEPLLVLDPARDDIIVTVFSLNVEPGPGNTTLTRYPVSGDYRQTGKQVSAFTADDLMTKMTQDSAVIVDSGILMVEIYWGYDQVLGLPWLDPFMPDPLMLHAYTIMPLVAAEPVDPTPP